MAEHRNPKLKLMKKSATTKIHVKREPFMGNVFQFVLAVEDDAGVSLADTIKLRRLTEAERCYEPKPTFTLKPEDAQQLLDELWRAGLRPLDLGEERGSLRATQAHLEDMRRLVFDGKIEVRHAEA